MKTLEDLDYPKGHNLTFDYTISNEEVFKQTLFETFAEILIDYGCGYYQKGKLIMNKEDEDYYTFEMKGEGYRETDIFFNIYETEEDVIVEWKYNPIQTGYLVKLKVVGEDE